MGSCTEHFILTTDLVYEISHMFVSIYELTRMVGINRTEATTSCVNGRSPSLLLQADPNVVPEGVH